MREVIRSSNSWNGAAASEFIATRESMAQRLKGKINCFQAVADGSIVTSGEAEVIFWEGDPA